MTFEDLKTKFEKIVFYCPECKFHIVPEVKKSSEDKNAVVFCKDCQTVLARVKYE